jgi:hypothetical protein
MINWYNLLQEIKSSNIDVDVIAVQEIWEVRYPELLTIPGFKQLNLCSKRGGT